MDITNIRLDNTDNLSISGKIILIGIELSRVFENGKITDNSDGYKIKCVLPDNNYEKITVKILMKPSTTQEMIDTSEKPIYCDFEDFEAKIYRDFRNNGYGLSCKAKALIIAK